MQPDKKDLIVLGSAILLMLVGIILSAVVPIKILGYFTNDDAYYYFKTAINIVQGKGVTFDGINLTNGFHPLWMVLSTFFAYVSGADRGLLLRLIYVVSFMLLGGTIFLCWLCVKRISGVFGGIAAILCFLNPLVLSHILNGLESGLLIFLIFLLLWISQKYNFLDSNIALRKQVLLGLMLGLIFLCRLDCAFILISFAFVICFVNKVKVWSPLSVLILFRRYCPLSMTFILAVLPYFIWNVVVNNHFTPISGVLKSSFPYPIGDLSRVASAYWLPYSVTIVLPLIWIVFSLVHKNDSLRVFFRSKFNLMALVIWIGLVLHFTYTILFTTWGIMYWTFASYIPIFLIIVGMVCKKITGYFIHKRITAATVFSLIISVNIILNVIVWIEKGNVHSIWYDAAMWVSENTQEDAVFAMTDCGYFAYFSQRTTVNLDGLINGYEYQEAISNGYLKEYFDRCGIDYIVDYEVRDESRNEHKIKLNRILYSAKRAGKSGYLLIMPISESIYASEVYRQRVLTEPKELPVRFRIWKYNPKQIQSIENYVQASVYSKSAKY